jgi:hypothetical protein
LSKCREREREREMTTKTIWGAAAAASLVSGVLRDIYKEKEKKI